MRTLLRGGTIIAFDRGEHRVLEGGALVFEGSEIRFVGKGYADPVDRTVDVEGKLVIPGLVNTHVHVGLNTGDYLLNDVGRSEYLGANYLSFLAPRKGTMGPLPGDVVRTIREFCFAHLIRNGCTTVIDAGGVPGDWDDYVQLVGRAGLRVYFSPPFGSADVYSDGEGRFQTEWDEAGGLQGLEDAAKFIETHSGSHGGRLMGILSPANLEFLGERLITETMAAANRLDVPVFLHAGVSLLEFHEILRRHRATPIAWLHRLGALAPRTILGHGVFVAGHTWSAFPYGDDLGLIAASGASVSHSALKEAKVGVTLESFDRYRRRGINLALGTDTYPHDMIREMGLASLIARIAERNFQGGTPRDVFNAATLGGARALRRDDLGRLAPGAKADLVILDLRRLGLGLVRDPIKALCEFGTSAHIETVIVDGATVVADGRLVGRDEAALFEAGQRVADAFWGNTQHWDWARRRVDEIVPRAFGAFEA
jgi:cytosine/adenosine deaminase-related metal-dependent hydrolase